MSQDLDPTILEEGRVALVTGGAKRIGASTVHILHRKGYRIAIHYNTSTNEAIALKDKLNTIREDSATTVQADLSVNIESNCKDVVMQAHAKWGRLDVIVNNASVFFAGSLEETTEKIWDEQMDTNAKAPFFLIKAAAPFLRETRGCAVNIGDCMGHRSYPGHIAYAVSKAAIMVMTQSLAVELAPEIRVNCVAPGAASWPSNGDYDDNFKKSWISRVPMGRVGCHEDIAAMVEVLANPKTSNYITGQIFNVDGGRTAQQ